MRILLVEDTVALADELSDILRRAGYVVDWSVDGRDAVRKGIEEHYDVIALDLGLPGRDGLEVLKEWRRLGSRVPVLVLTARGSWAERIDGLKAGADDYLCKPFHPEEFVLRLQSILRRSHGLVNAPLKRGSLQLDEATQSAIQSGRPVELTRGEFRLLRLLMLNEGRVVTRLQLAESLYEANDEKESNVIDVHINHLRKKIGRQHIDTLRGQGYRFVGQVAAHDG